MVNKRATVTVLTIEITWSSKVSELVFRICKKILSFESPFFFLELQHIHVYWTICKLNIKRSRTKLRFHNHYVIYLRSSKEYDQQQYYLDIRVWRSFLSWKSTYIPCFSYSKWAHGGCHIRRYLRQINDRTAKKKK